jgi:hypothetical protein
VVIEEDGFMIQGFKKIEDAIASLYGEIADQKRCLFGGDKAVADIGKKGVHFTNNLFYANIPKHSKSNIRSKG